QGAPAARRRRRCPPPRRNSCHGTVIKGDKAPRRERRIEKGAPTGALFAGPAFFVAAGTAKPHKPRMNAPATFDPRPPLPSALKAIESLKPSEPLYLVHPEKFAAAAKQFLDGFPGDVLYAVKANPHPIALIQLWNAGIRHFDTASLGEIEAVKGLFADAICHFMAPVRLPGQAKVAFEKHGVTDFV